MRIYLPRRRKGGKIIQGRKYRVRFSVEGRKYDLALNLTDKRAAEEKARLLRREKEQESVRVIPSKAQRDAAALPLSDHFQAYLSDRRRRKLGEKYTDTIELRLNKLFDRCSWRYHGDITCQSFETWAAGQSDVMSGKTLNDYLGAVRAFLSWMRKRGLAEGDPLEAVDVAETKGRAKVCRRAFTVDELRKLIAISGPRGELYLAAVTTGLRRGELDALRWSDVHINGDDSFILARAATTKNRKDGLIPLHPELRRILETRKAVGVEIDEAVFPKLYRMWHFKRDLVAAGIPHIDACGRRADFHSLRHTYCTLLAASGAGQRVAQELMRHSDPRLTSKVYTDAGLLPLAAAVRNLPNLLPQDSRKDSLLDRLSRLEVEVGVLKGHVEHLQSQLSPLLGDSPAPPKSG